MCAQLVRDTACGRGRVDGRTHLFACRIYEGPWTRGMAQHQLPPPARFRLRRLKAWLEAQGLSQKELAAAINVHPSLISRIFRGSGCRLGASPSLSTLAFLPAFFRLRAATSLDGPAAARANPVQCFWSVQATRPTSCVSFLARGSVRGGWSLFSPRSMSTSWPISRKTRLKTSPAPGSMRA